MAGNPSYDRVWLAQALKAQSLGPCAKQTVVARVQSPNGVEYVGTNGCKNPQPTCPRDERGYKTGEGYELCQEICRQDGHAEYKALASAGVAARGATLRVEGHTYACSGCTDLARRMGIADLVVGGGFVRLNPREAA